MHGWVLHLAYLARATRQFRGESSDHLDVKEQAPQFLAQVFSIRLHALCELCLRSDLRTLAQ